MDLPLFIEHASACGPQIEAVTLAKIAKQESALRPWALSVNYPLGTARKLGEPGGYARLATQPQSKAQAVRWAARLVEQGHTVSFGLMQVSSQNLSRLGYTLEQAYDPCANIKIAALLLAEKLERARKLAPNDPLPTALSIYNSGDAWTGFANGYVSGVLGQTVATMPVSVRFPTVPSLPVIADSEVAEKSFRGAPTSRRVGVRAVPGPNYRAALAAPTSIVWNKP